MSNEIKRKEFPRPDFVRKDWMSLNGEWEFQFDKDGMWTAQDGAQLEYERKIQVPFCYQAELSGIGVTEDCPVVWYRRSVKLKKETGKRILLKFGAVDYKCDLWVNGTYIGGHEGGHCSFAFDITRAALEGENQLILRVEDYQDTDKPRGKQSWTGEPFGCWYTPTTGIWQSVWAEYVPDIYLERIKITPDLTHLSAKVEVFLSACCDAECEIASEMEIDGEQRTFGTVKIRCRNGYGKAMLAFPDFDLRRDQLYWRPEHPNLIHVQVTVKGSEAEDQVSTYFGMRDVKVCGKQILLNQEAYFQRLVLNQGYWEESLLTPPSEEAIIRDLELVKAMGFNGVRMHQKIEDPLFYYHADRLGVLVWGELPSSYEYNDNMVRRSVNEMMEFVNRDYNHPSIVAWVPVNESWGVRDILTNEEEQNYAQAMVHLLKAMDGTRFVSANDGWEQPSDTDICAIHDYIYTQHTLGKYENMDKILDNMVESRMVFANGHSYSGQPVVMTEYGGIAFDDSKEGWGYLGKVKTEEEFLERLGAVTDEIIHCGKFAGFCYTQLTDVQQEINGLLRTDRSAQVSVERLKEIFARKFFERRLRS